MFLGWDRALNAEAHKWFSFNLPCGRGRPHRGPSPVPQPSKIPLQQDERICFHRRSCRVFRFVRLITGAQLESPIKRTLVEAPLSALAGVTDTTPDGLLVKRKARGTIATSQQSVRDLSAEYHVDENQLLAILFPSR